MELTDFLQWLVFSGGAVVAFSWFAEQFPSWHALTAELKKLYSFLGSALLALGGWAILNYAPDVMLQALYEPFFILSGLFAMIFLGQRWHSATK